MHTLYTVTDRRPPTDVVTDFEGDFPWSPMVIEFHGWNNVSGGKSKGRKGSFLIVIEFLIEIEFHEIGSATWSLESACQERSRSAMGTLTKSRSCQRGCGMVSAGWSKGALL